jgi:hypothetical protein
VEFGELPDDATKGLSDDHQKRRRYNVVVALNGEQMAAAEGWRAAHGIADQAEALGELIKLGLLSEIAKIYRLVTEGRMPPSDVRTEADGPVQYKY